MSSSQIGLAWSASSDDKGVVGYQIERCSGASCASFVQVSATTGATSLSDSGLSASTSYSYRIRAVDAAGNLSAYSNIASATTSAAADTTAPTVPGNLAATVSSSAQINLTWMASTDNVGVTSYRVERCSGASCSMFAEVGTTSGAAAFSDSGLSAATSYSYRVRAGDAANNLSGYSNTASATTSSAGGSNISVKISPRRGGLATSQTLSVTATLTNDTANQGVSWSFSSTGATSGGGFSSVTSSSGAAVTFTAPSGAGVVTIRATAVGDNTKTASATIGVTDLSGVLTYHNNLSRDGTNPKEYALTTSNVTPSSFGKVFTCAADGAIYAQPLWIPKVNVGGGTHNVVLVATIRDSLYLFDADNSPCTTYWSKTLIPTGETYGSYADLGSSDIFPDIGILGTPVIDPSTNAVYLVTKTKSTSTGNYVQRLHALNLADGSERSNSPVTIDSSVSVSGNCDLGTSVSFDARLGNQRPGLALINGVVFVSWASHGDQGDYHGWVIGYNPQTLARVSTLNVTPNRSTAVVYCRGGIWMSGGAPAADSSNNIYLMTGNGAFDPPISDYSDSYLKLSSSLAVSDYFTPHNQSNLDNSDSDVGAGGTALLIDQTSGPVAHLLVGAGKSGTFYVLNRDNMGHFNSSSDAAAVQTWATNSHCFSTPAFWNNTMYYFGVTFGSSHLGEQYAFNNSTGQFNTTPVQTTPSGLGFPGATPSVSSTGNSNGIVWAIDSSNYGTKDSGSFSAGPAVLHAYDASNISTELWNSTQGSGNTAGNAVKFTVPTVANGKVYIGTRGNDTTTGSGTLFGELDVYGLLPN
jgi:chitodextrinase